MRDSLCFYVGLMETGIFKYNWSSSPGTGVILAKFPSFEAAYEVGNQFWPMLSMEIKEVIFWEKTKELVLTQAKEAAGQ